MGKEYLYQVGEIVNETLRIVEQTRVANGKKYTQKGYVVQSLAYPNSRNNYMVAESNLKKGQRCAYVMGYRVCEESSLWSNESVRPHIVDVEQAKTISRMNGKKILFKCSTDGCNNLKKMAPCHIVRHGFACQMCSTGISYPEKFMLSVNKYFKLSLEYQVTYEHGRFDFVDHENKIVIEMNGRAHYEDTSWEGSYESTVISDNKKRKWCKENGYTLIFIDARKSDFTFIKNNINQCKHLPNIKKEDEKAIMELIEISSKYDIKEIKRLYEVEKLSTTQIAQKYNVHHATIGRVLRRNGVKLRNGTQNSLTA